MKSHMTLTNRETFLPDAVGQNWFHWSKVFYVWPLIQTLHRQCDQWNHFWYARSVRIWMQSDGHSLKLNMFNHIFLSRIDKKATLNHVLEKNSQILWIYFLRKYLKKKSSMPINLIKTMKLNVDVNTCHPSEYSSSHRNTIKWKFSRRHSKKKHSIYSWIITSNKLVYYMTIACGVIPAELRRFWSLE